MTGRRRGGTGFDPQQLQIDWSSGPASPPPQARTEGPAIPPPSVPANGLTLKLKWDFRTSFPEPTEEAIEAGTISAEDMHTEGIRSIHEEHVREMLATLHDLDTVLEARSRGVDPRNNKAPMLAPAKERLQKFFQTEPARLERWFENLLGVYQDAFGQEAAEAFGQAVRAWHAGVEVVAESTPKATPPLPAATGENPVSAVKPKRVQRAGPRRVTACLPVPRPLCCFPVNMTASHQNYLIACKPESLHADLHDDGQDCHPEILLALMQEIMLSIQHDHRGRKLKRGGR
ncbi:MAG: hypothetical protein ABSF29_00295 [Tepidisphaeraceae bacterium]